MKFVQLNVFTTNTVNIQKIAKKIYFILFTAHRGLEFITLYIQYSSVICRPSDHTLERPQAEIRSRDG